ncbi:DUF389 domain-containing protein [Candidatus Saccharibacteria bacterium]|nr:DUF389 domain-containing protein [Candidatus Saccharibacteria bacterium]MCB9821482.1 DUF389 domain-containing protein [Candidatus Nomurabacteria bacterium]
MAKKFNLLERQINWLFAKDSLISDELLEEKMRSYSRFSVSYYLLLTASTVIATLGLLMNASAIVIGSMIISPLTWPMFGLADGASLGNHKRIRNNLYIIIASVAYGVLLAYILTIFSPLKVINSEIITRSTPTLLDAAVAIMAGAIGAMAIVRKNISDTVAGVAVALSLTPPMCVIGISLALGETAIVKGSSLLLLTNALSITLVAGITMILVHYSWRRKLQMAPKAFIIMLLSLSITAIPLYQLLKTYSLESSSYVVVQTELKDYINAISPNGSVKNISTSLESRSGQDVLVVDADVFLPPSVNLTYDDKDKLTSELSNSINRLVDLRLHIQPISLLSNLEDIKAQDTIRSIRDSFSKHLNELSSDLNIIELDVSQHAETWTISAQLSGPADSLPDESAINQLNDVLSAELQKSIKLDISYLPLIQIKTDQQSTVDVLKSELQTLIKANVSGAVVNSVEVTKRSGNTYLLLEIKLPDSQSVTTDLAQDIKSLATRRLKTPVTLQLRLVYYSEELF